MTEDEAGGCGDTLLMLDGARLASGDEVEAPLREDVTRFGLASTVDADQVSRTRTAKVVSEREIDEPADHR